MAVEPTTSELARRIDDVSRRMDAGFRDVNAQLSALPDKETILAYLATRDVELRNVRDDVADLTKSLAGERTERIAAITAVKADATSAKRFAVTAALGSASFLLGLLGYLAQAKGGA